VNAIPWSAKDRQLLVLRLGAGAVVVLAAWFFAAGETDPADQLPFVSLALLGALLGMWGVFSWVTRGRRLVGQRARFLLGAAPVTNIDLASAEVLVAGGARHWFHRADCLLAASRGWPAASRSAHESAGRRPCPACKP
jgi:hypothetical protein